MRILIDIQTLYTPEKNRGIGIYTYNWIKDFIKQDNSHRYYLLRKKNNKWEFSFVTQYIDFDKRIQEDHNWEIGELEDFVEKKHIDIIHFTSPLMFDIEVPKIENSKVKISYLVYDLIPLVMQEQYYAKWPQHIQNLYNSRCELIAKADMVLTISEASKNDLLKFYPMDSSKIHVIYASTNENLYHPGKSGSENTIINEELGLSSPFIYSLTGYDPRKNNKGLINAFSKVVKELPNIKLVISGIKQETEKAELTSYARENGISDKQILFLGFVSDDCLVSLYKECELFVFPSLYEGFGLPVLEAMRCGAPVITTKSSSIPEVTNNAAILVDVNNDEMLAEAIISILTNKQLSEELKIKSIKQAEKFSWDHSTQLSLHAFQMLASTSLLNLELNSEKPVMAYFSPLNPQSSGISDYSEELLTKLKDYFDIKIFVNGYIPENSFIKDNFVVLDYKDHFNELEQIKIRVYHMGNNELHSWIYDAIINYPGSVVLHDLNLYGFYIYTKYLRGDKTGFVNELAYSHGQKGLHAGEQLLTMNTYPNDQEFPMFKKVVEISNQVIVHSKWVKDKIEIESDFQGSIVTIPSGILVNESSLTKVELKKSLQMDLNKISIGVFGNVIPNKRIDVILRVISELIKTNTNIELNIIGHCNSEMKEHIMKNLKKMNINNYVKIIPGPSLEIFKKYIEASDLCINLRWPTFGETSATLVRSLGYGVPCIVSNVGSYMEYPDSCVWKVDVDEYEEELLLAYLMEIVNNPMLRNEMGAFGELYMKENHDFNVVAKLFSQALLD
ncbi:glycosyltransferase [Paenibacillus sp. RC67]|uniref:glycosyltransferase n=1 Tax=Paenibacillus sp. RC67 TaxID=3039392 RepID=UPI0024AC8BCA|nr:glycosyltransferase [Paenibacillus sp. RC67]